MNVQQLRDSDHVESVETYYYSTTGNESDNWRVTPNHDSYNSQEGLQFLLDELNVKYELSNGDLVVPKGNITN